MNEDDTQTTTAESSSNAVSDSAEAGSSSEVVASSSSSSVSVDAPSGDSVTLEVIHNDLVSNAENNTHMFFVGVTIFCVVLGVWLCSWVGRSVATWFKF